MANRICENHGDNIFSTVPFTSSNPTCDNMSQEVAMSKEWFKHDVNARHDTKMVLMRGTYGAEGYGVYWMLIETLRETKGHRFKKKHLPALCLDFAYPKINEFIHDCVNTFNLLSEDDEYVWSPSLLARMENYNKLCEERAEYGRKGGQAKAKQELSKRGSKKVATRIDLNRLDKNREEEKKHGDVVSLADSDYNVLCYQYGKVAVESKIDDINNWCKAKNKTYKDYAAAIRMWFKKDGVLPQPKPKVCPNGHFYTGDICEACI